MNAEIKIFLLTIATLYLCLYINNAELKWEVIAEKYLFLMHSKLGCQKDWSNRIQIVGTDKCPMQFQQWFIYWQRELVIPCLMSNVHIQFHWIICYCHCSRCFWHFFQFLLRTSCEWSNWSNHVIIIYINDMRLCLFPSYSLWGRMTTRIITKIKKKNWPDFGGYLNESRKNAFFLTVIWNGHVVQPKSLEWHKKNWKIIVSKCTWICIQNTCDVW